MEKEPPGGGLDRPHEQADWALGSVSGLKGRTEVPVWRVLKCQCHTHHPAWLQLADIAIENLSVSWWREGPAASPHHSPALREAPVSGPE